MIGKSLVLAAAAAICCAALTLAQEPAGAGGEGKGNGDAAAGFRLPASLLVSCPVISRLGLDGAQTEKARGLEAQAHAGIEAAAKAALADGGKRNDYYKKRREILAGLRTGIAELLAPEQKRKYDEGQKIVEECELRISQALKEYLKARGEAGKDTAAVTEAREAYYGKKNPVVAEMNRRLDEKVGRQPQPAKARSGDKDPAKAG